MKKTGSLTGGILPISITEEMQSSYLDYAMSVIVSRALPNVRDGLKPVHRRILYSMNESGFDFNKPYRKSARVTGDVMAKYHPHGNAAIYDAMVRMAQDFSLRLPLIDGQGNFGSMDGDPAAAERYTEARLAKVARYLLDDIDKDTVDFRPNYDGSESEPVLLPARFPNILVNGAGGIAVGMATNIPPHNLGELIDACTAYIENPDLSLLDLIGIVKGPDFPTGGIIIGLKGIYSAFENGRGSIIIRSKTHVEEVRKDKKAIIITEIPYQVNKSRMLEKIAETVKNKLIEGISDLRDESDRDGVRVVIELKRDAIVDVVLNQLYRYTPVQNSFGANMLAIDNGTPKLLCLKDFIRLFVQFREEIIIRRTKFELAKSQGRAHILIGLAVAVANLDKMINMIKAAKDPQAAKEQILQECWNISDVATLIKLVNEPGQTIENNTYRLSEAQTKAILELRLHRLTGLEREKIAQELKDIVNLIADLLATLASQQKILTIMKEELAEVKEKFATPRKTAIDDSEAFINTENLIEKKDMVVTVSQNGYIKRVPLSIYRSQKRGGKGRSAISMRDEDIVSDIFVADTHTPILFFSNKGIAYMLKVYKLPCGSLQSLGKALVNLLPLDKDEIISTIMLIKGDKENLQNCSIIFATSSGKVRRNALTDFLDIRANGKIAMDLENSEELIAVRMCFNNEDIFLTTKLGKCIRFNIDQLRVFASRKSTGVKGIKLAPKDEIVSLSILKNVVFSTQERDEYLKVASVSRKNLKLKAVEGISLERMQEMAAQEQFVVSVSSKGFGKLTSAYEYRVSHRSGQGIANMLLSTKNGNVVGSFVINRNDDLVLVTDQGKLIRFSVKDVRIAGRSTKGVTLLKIHPKEHVVSVARINVDDLIAEEECQEELASTN